MSQPTLYSGQIGAEQGFDSPEPFNGPSGWTVFKSQQTEIYEVVHNLGLSNPQQQLHVAVTAMTPGVIANIDSVSANSFVISTWVASNQAPTATDLMFVAVYHSTCP